jgi:hypothetical protein
MANTSVWAKPDPDLAALRAQMASPEPAPTVWAPMDDSAPRALPAQPAPHVIWAPPHTAQDDAMNAQPVNMPDTGANLHAGLEKVFPPAQPQVALDPNPQHQIEGHLTNRLQQEYAKDAPWNPDDHGTMGKIGHVFSKIGGGLADTFLPGVVPGTSTYRHDTENNIAHELNSTIGEESQQALQGAQTSAAQQQADLHQQQARAAELTPATQEESDTYNIPLGTPLNAAIRGALAKNSQTVQGRQSVAEAGNQTKLTVAQLQDANREAVAAGKPAPHVITMQGGQPHVMERDPATKEYSIDRGIAPPNYAQMLPMMLATKTTELLGDDDVQHRYQFDPKTGAYSSDMGAAPTGTAAHQIFQGAAIEKLGPQVIADINANRAILGNLPSYYKQWLSGTPVSDPKAAELMSELMSFASTQPALHGFRSTNAMEAYEKILGGLAKNPDATIASINGLMKTSQAFTGLGGHGPTNSKQLAPGDGAKPPDPNPNNAKPGYHRIYVEGHGWGSVPNG